MSSAIISECKEYRYLLTRQIPQLITRRRPAVFVMLNPSKADATIDDPTIRRCFGFAKRWGCSELRVVNLFALMATNPKELYEHKDPIGKFNDKEIDKELDVFSDGGFLIAAWGGEKIAKSRAQQIVDKYWKVLLCLGKTKDGSPRHPLFVKYDTELEFLVNKPSSDTASSSEGK